MYLIEVIPIARGIPHDVLTYFSLEQPPIGSIITVPLRNKDTPALVQSVRPASEEKARIKHAGFELKKISSLEPRHLFPPSYIETARHMAAFYISPLGTILKNIVPSVVLQAPDIKPLDTATPTPALESPRHVLIRAFPEERMADYRSRIREAFAQKRSVFVCAPTIEDVERLNEHIRRGIEPYTFSIHSDLSDKILVHLWNTIAHTEHPIVVIGTPLFLGIPRLDLGLIIIEREGSRAYRMQTRPHIDLRRLAEGYAHAARISCIRGDTVVSVERWSQFNTTNTGEYREHRPEHIPHIQLIDMSTYKPAEGVPFTTLSQELTTLIERTIRDKKHLFIFSPRKGLYPTTVCADCGTVVLCTRCSSPVVVHTAKTSPKKYLFICHQCGVERPTEERCKTCDSWRLASLGIGIERVQEDILKAYPHAPIFILDKQTESTRIKARKKMTQFTDTPGSIMIGTEYALLYLTGVDHAAVASLDSLFLIPDFRMHERILNTLLTIQGHVKDSYIIQTRTPDNPLFTHIYKKSLRDFYITELEQRKQLGYPPARFYIKISRSGEKKEVEQAMQTLTQKLDDYHPLVYPGHIETVKNAYTMHLSLALDPDEWVDDRLKSILVSLPPAWSIKIDPDSLL